ncbi:Transcriptional regulator, TetR family [Frankia sp. AiPs1]|uniref:TetR/AcrR family transcriptional regulator n=1 Tax=Frankia sp. AiPa1 TaxID=573492 RepID=UPI00202B8399|nr:TetR/AcrR family transcriptional regulator [Frankia sp. AiPa1]MCL9762875.1 TetR/AcrR family transcriptional regulator [Frankia sp. AiPa1]
MFATPSQPAARDQRADARRNYDHILATARTVITEQGVQASLRDVARRAEVGLGTLYRHFPTREALLAALMRQGFDRLVRLADDLAATHPPATALAAWLRELAIGAGTYQGLSASLVAILNDPESALASSCTALHSTGARLLARAQADGSVRPDVTGIDVFVLATAVASLTERGPLAERRDHLLDVMFDGLRPTAPSPTAPGSGDDQADQAGGG